MSRRKRTNSGAFAHEAILRLGGQVGVNAKVGNQSGFLELDQQGVERLELVLPVVQLPLRTEKLELILR
jgi:hypothetical protein